MLYKPIHPFRSSQAIQLTSKTILLNNNLPSQRSSHWLADIMIRENSIYLALKSSIAGVISTVNRKKCLEEQWRYHNSIVAEHKAEMEAIEAKIASINAVEGNVLDVGSESKSRSNKRRRTWWQGLWEGA